jgi:hypothetical protein
VTRTRSEVLLLIGLRLLPLVYSSYTQQSALMCILPDVIRNVTTADCYTIVLSVGISGLSVHYGQEDVSGF